MVSLWSLGLLAVAAYCIRQAARDYRRGDYGMAVAGGAAAALIVLMQIQAPGIIEIPVRVAS